MKLSEFFGGMPGYGNSFETSEKMDININVTFGRPGQSSGDLSEVISLLKEMRQFMGNEFQNLEAAVEAQGDVVKSAVTLLGGLEDQIRSIGGPKAQALADKVSKNTQDLADAVAAGTVADPTSTTADPSVSTTEAPSSTTPSP